MEVRDETDFCLFDRGADSEFGGMWGGDSATRAGGDGGLPELQDKME